MTYPWTDNATVSGVAQCDTDVLNDCLMHLKYNNATRNIGEIVTSTIPLTDAELHLLDGSLISGGGSYGTFVDYIISLYYNNASIYYKWEATFNGTTYTTYTRVKKPTTDDYYYSTYGTTQIQRFAEYNVGNITWQVDGSGAIYYATSEATLVGTGLIGNVTPTPPSYFETEANWQTSVTTYGVCGKFVYDSVNNTVRLPKITGFTEGTITPSSVGDLTEAGLPNITGSISGGVQGYFSTYTGAFYKINARQKGNLYNNDYHQDGLGVDASLSNSIYGNSNTVQPQSIKVLYYIVIATSTKTDIQVDIDEIATDLNGKADVDLTNCTKPHIVETYVNGTSWYRVYSDGWCEQGGYIAYTTDYAMLTINFLKPFINTNYNFSRTWHSTYTTPSTAQCALLGYNTKSTNSITIQSSVSPYGVGSDWQACGYIS